MANLKPFVSNVVPIETPHCINYKCRDSCSKSNFPFEKDLTPDQEVQLRKRDISDEQSHYLCDGLMELKDKFEHHCSLEVHGFSN